MKHKQRRRHQHSTKGSDASLWNLAFGISFTSSKFVTSYTEPSNIPLLH
jgi:hypothetical protein